MKAFADSVSSQKRAAADGECREESLLQETASKEAAMATRMEEVQADLKQARLALGNAHAEIERLGVFSNQMKKVWWPTQCTCILVLCCIISALVLNMIHTMEPKSLEDVLAS